MALQKYARGYEGYALSINVLEIVLEVLESVCYVLGAIKDVLHLLKVLEAEI